MSKSIWKFITPAAAFASLCLLSTTAAGGDNDGWLTCKDGIKVHSGASCTEHGGVLIAASKSTPIDTRKGFSSNKTAKSKKQTTAGNATQKKTTSTSASGPNVKCNDGATYFAKAHKGACSRHGGVKHWL